MLKKTFKRFFKSEKNIDEAEKDNKMRLKKNQSIQKKEKSNSKKESNISKILKPNSKSEYVKTEIGNVFIKNETCNHSPLKIEKPSEEHKLELVSNIPHNPFLVSLKLDMINNSPVEDKYIKYDKEIDSYNRQVLLDCIIPARRVVSENITNIVPNNTHGILIKKEDEVRIT